jgi:uncharacterized iron-regulated membrane protein
MTRRPFLLWHRWFGLAAAAWLFLLGATGSILVFYEEIDHALNSEAFTATAGKSQPVDRIVAAALVSRPDYAVRFVNLPNEPGDVAEVHLSRRPDLPKVEGHVPAWEVFVDPATLRVTGYRDNAAIDLSRKGIMGFFYKFHYSLHLGKTIEWVIGLIAFLWLFDHFASVVLSFPNRAKWRESFRIRRGVSGYKLVFDWHRAGGLWLFPITLTLAISGLYFNWSDEFKATVNAISPITPRTDEATAKLPAPLVAPPISFDRAQIAANGAKVDGIAYNADKALYWVRAFDERDIGKNGRRWIFVDARNGRVVSDSHAADGTAGDIIMAWQFPLHSGKAFGWWGRIAIFISGMMVCGFVVTGVMMWNRKRKARAFQARSRVNRAICLQPAE